MNRAKGNIQPAERLNRVGEYYFSGKLQEIARMRASGQPVLNLGIGSPDLPPHPEVVEELILHSRDQDNHAYQSYRGIPELREAFADWYALHYGVRPDPTSEVLPLIGSKEGIMHIAMSFLEEGDAALVPNPGYPAYRAATRLAGASAISYNLSEDNQWLPDFEALEQMDLRRVKVMWVNYPHMPTGTGATQELFEKLVAFARNHGILLVHDNPYSFILSEPRSLLSVEGAKDVALELNSLSKSHNMAGWRIGALIGRADYLDAVLRFKSNMDSGQFKPMQMASIRALCLSDNWYAQQNEVYSRRREIAGRILQSLGCGYRADQCGLFLWARIPAQFTDGYTFSQWLLTETHLFITPGGVFGDQGDQFVRISLCSSEEMLEEAMERLKGVRPERTGEKADSDSSHPNFTR